jgi:hypothetical protein
MGTPTSRVGGLHPVRLTEVPLKLRLEEMHRLLNASDHHDLLGFGTGDLGARLQIGFAAESPSDRVYWVSRAAYEKVMRKANQPRYRRRRGTSGRTARASATTPTSSGRDAASADGEPCS